MPTSFLVNLLDYTEELYLRKDQKLKITEESNNYFYIVYDGYVNLLQKDIVINNLTESEFLGEILIEDIAENDLVLNDRSITGKHARITVERGRVYLQDLKSTNGTYYNGAALQIGEKVRLEHRDEFSLGKVVLEYLELKDAETDSADRDAIGSGEDRRELDVRGRSTAVGGCAAGDSVGHVGRADDRESGADRDHVGPQLAVDHYRVDVEIRVAVGRRCSRFVDGARAAEAIFDADGGVAQLDAGHESFSCCRKEEVIPGVDRTLAEPIVPADLSEMNHADRIPLAGAEREASE